jgi:hypothetical protein
MSPNRFFFLLPRSLSLLPEACGECRPCYGVDPDSNTSTITATVTSDAGVTTSTKVVACSLLSAKCMTCGTSGCLLSEKHLPINPSSSALYIEGEALRDEDEGRG